MTSYAKIMFAGLAVYLTISIVRNLLFTITYAFREFSFGSVGIVIFSLLLSGAYLAAIIYVLVLKSDKWARKLIANEIEPDSSPTPEITLTMAFRLVCIGAGLYCSSHFIWSCSNMLTNLIRAMKYEQQTDRYREMFSRGLSVDYIQPLLYLALAVYLLCGAPHFVRWQVKQTLKLCNKPEEFKNNPSQ